MKKALITGISGFAGSYLAAHLLESGEYEVCGTYLDEESLKNLDQRDQINLAMVNLLDENKTREVVESEKPDEVYHLAALTSPKNSFDDPKETFTNNISAQINVLEAVKKVCPEAKILIVSSAEIYGIVSAQNLPIDEDTPFFPSNPYAVSKLAQDYLGLEYNLSQKLKIVRVRPFNHVGPRQSPSFVVSAFAKRIAEIEKGKESVMKVGNLSSKRDFTDVRDMVSAYQLALEKGKEGEVYNIGSGVSYEISKILEMLVGLSTEKIEVQKDESLMLPTDNPELRANVTKFKDLTGWNNKIDIGKTLKDTLDYWREVI